MIFSYTARDKNGQVKQGFVEAVSVDQAAEILRSRELIPTQITEKTTSPLSGWLQRLRGVSAEELMVVTRQLATMVSAGLPLARALEILVAQTRNPRFREILSSSLRDVQAGASLSSTLEKHQEVFSPIYVNLVKAGEASGSLDKILQRLAENLEKRHQFVGRTKGALIYPAIVVFGIVVVFIIMMVFVVPKLTDMYRDLGAQLPLPTRVIIGISDFMIGFWWLMIVLSVGLMVLLARLNNTRQGRRYFTGLSMRLPIFGPIINQTQLAELARTLGLLISSGVPILESLDIAKGSVSNVLYRDSVERAAVTVEKGAPLSLALQSETVFPPSVSQMIAVGEETGKVDEVLLKVAKFFEDEVDQSVRNLSSALEPMIMVILGIMVGFLILAVILPIYSLTSQL
jgi:type IV pilus assembly protein PilC